MTTPIEETWVAEYGDCDPDDRGSIEIWHTSFPDGHAVYLYDDESRARLISAAPDMARVLLAIEWEGETTDEGRCDRCPSCGRYPPTELALRDEGHATDCALDAALRKAGVR